MCLMLYLGAPEDLPPASTPDLRVEPVDAARRGVERWFSLPAVRFVGAHTGCSCGFPSVIAEVPIEYYEGMDLESDDRDADLRSVRALLALLRGESNRADRVELYPVAAGDEGKAPKGRIDWRLDELDPERLFFNEGFMHVVHLRRSGDP